MKNGWIVVCAILTAGCASTEQRKNEFASAMDAWIGKSSDDLVTAKGPPRGSYELSTRERVLEYELKPRESAGSTGFGASTGVVSGGGGSGWFFMPSISFSSAGRGTGCKVQFVVNAKNVIESWKPSGDDCY